MDDRELFGSRLAEIIERITEAAGHAGRDPKSVRVVAVTKTQPSQVVRDGLAAGMTDFGENKVQEALSKFDELSDLRDRFRLHLIGHLQSNKAKQAVQHFDLVHSVDSLKLAAELNRHAAATQKTCNVLLQVNISHEDTKSGFDPKDLRRDFDQLLEQCGNLRFHGFMTMAPLAVEAEGARPHFSNMRQLAEELVVQAKGAPNWVGCELSMGMTGDYEVAVEEGATLVRIGTAIFGRR